MTRVISRGKCVYCDRELSKSAMANHLKSCKQRMDSIEAESSASKKVHTTTFFHLVVEGAYRRMYWMHLEVPASVTLDDLDSFLRNIWLECCGHLSAFQIGEVKYHSDSELAGGDNGGDDLLSELQPGTPGQLSSEVQAEIAQMVPPERLSDFIQYVRAAIAGQPSRPLRRNRSMAYKLGQVLKPGIKFSHEYDFGSTTELTLKVVAEREGQVRGRKKAIQIMARNEVPFVPCDVCGEKPATLLDRGWDDPDNWLCKDCAGATRNMGRMIPIANSPRVGVCGYTGRGSSY